MKTIYKNIFKKFLLLVFVVGAKALFAQQDIVLNDIIVGKAEVSASHSITLKKGFVAKAGSTFRAYIDPNVNSTVTNPVITSTTTVTVTGTPTTGTNYIRTKSFPATTSRNEQIVYFDGLGRPVQKINVKGSPTGQDIIQHIYYDDLGRESRQYIPYTASGNGEYRTNAQNDVISYYQSTITGKSNTDSKPYSEIDFEASPLNRVLNNTGVGQEWNSKAVEYNYLTNTSAVNSWDVNGTSTPYAANSLYVNQTTDEEGNVIKEYKNLLGQVVLKESLNGTETLRTYYIYDDFGLLRTVVPPLATSPANTELCYFYTYDGRNRMISKKLPGAEILYMVYDKRDRLVLVQDGNLRNDGDATNESFRFTKYDEFNRPIMTGTIKIASTLENIRTLFKNHSTTTPYETYTGSGVYGYSVDKSYPASFTITAGNVETVSWYDNYSFLGLTSGLNYYTSNLPAGFNFAISAKTKGLATGSMVKAYEPEGSGYTLAKSELYSANYYDDNGNVIQTISQNHLGGRDVLSSRYEPVTHQLKAIQQQHILNNVAIIKIHENYTYDHAGRMLKTTHKINDQDEIVIASMRYNELGELIQKYLHSKDAQSFVQKIDYTYNIRGWLTKINDPALSENDVFGMHLYYNNLENLDNSTAPKEMYNGNIAAMRWNTAGDIERGYGFIYDGLNRLTSANYAEGSTLAANKGLFSENIAQYDKNGNIIKLNRRFNNASTYADQLTYSYVTGTNKLKKITDPAGDMTGIEDYVVRSTADYGYDKNGNMTFDPGKDARVSYNPLNLPESVSDNSNSVKIFYHYDAAGHKLAKTNESSSSSVDNTTDYIGNIIYVNNEIAYIMTSEGRMVPIADGDNTRWHYEYYIKDHLGNARVTFGGSLLSGKVDMVQQSHYYPFGLVFKETNYQNSIADYTKNKYLYNGKELQDDQLAGRSLNWYDYGARFYDPAIGRWHSIDPLAESYVSWTPYNYALNNPVRFIDPDGQKAFDPNKLNEAASHGFTEAQQYQSDDGACNYGVGYAYEKITGGDKNLRNSTTGNFKTANQMNKDLRNDKANWITKTVKNQEDLNNIQKLAGDGNFIIASTTGKDHGHVAVVRAAEVSEMSESGTWGVKTPIIMDANGGNEIGMNYGWSPSENEFTDITFFMYVGNDDPVNMNNPVQLDPVTVYGDPKALQSKTISLETTKIDMSLRKHQTIN
ncbi:MAG: hypothetical protein A2041_13175 [Bacteroidetes bacterium GWA2_31_9b]|nr:MAG: hypothetical protein A2041_13175 [Bacteroidetes bacterium GWA2_31_9b]